jgi:UDP-N-acetylglucosamine--N-acetylmuramyl-(pentapeptide) pyrophosphoryl-undecaprenol N-acetylglucosamine transferase
VSEGWGDLLAAADLVVSRAGANTLFELLALGKPNLLIPLSPRVSRGDQVENAGYALAHGYSRVLSEDDLTAQSLTAAVRAAHRDAADMCRRLADFRSPDAAAAIYAEIERVAKAHADG